MKKPAVVVLSLVVVVVAVLLVPFVFREKGHRLEGPALSEQRCTEVTFRNGDLRLAGLLFVPDGEGPFPVAVFIHGSGTSRRDSPWYLTVAQHLQRNGVAVLLPDKRGSEKSGGDWRTATFPDLASDACAAVAFVRSQSAFALSPVGIVGFSQGGWIAPVAANLDTSLDFVVSMSGPGVTTDEQLLYEEKHNIADAGTYHFVGALLAPVAVQFIKREAFWKPIGGFDPLPYWREVKAPAFMAFGGGDENVPVPESVQRIGALGRRNITVKVYSGGGHGIWDPATYRVQPAYLNDLAAFIHASASGR